MAPSIATQRSCALLATATVAFSGFAFAPASAADETAASSALAQVAEASSDKVVSEATLSWGIKDSWHSYFAKPFVGGKTELTDVVQKEKGAPYEFSQGTGSWSEADKSGTITFPGTIHFTGHKGQLDIKLSNVRVVINGDGSGTLVADAVSNDFKTYKPATYKDAKLGTLDLASLKVTDDAISLKDAAVTADLDMPKVFGDPYKEGTKLAPLTLEGKRTVAEEQQKPKAEETPAPKAHEDAKDAPAPAPEAPKMQEPAAPKPQVAQPEATATAFKVQSAEASWGVKESFISYIQGPIAHGAIERDKINDFTWSTLSGTQVSGFDTKSKEGVIAFDGTLHFTGHKGELDIKLSNLKVQVAGGKGYLIADVVSQRMDHSTFEQQNLQLGTVDIASLTYDESSRTVSLNQAPVALTALGTEAFGGFYEAGLEMAPLTVKAVLSDEPAGDLPVAPADQDAPAPAEAPKQAPAPEAPAAKEPVAPAQNNAPVSSGSAANTASRNPASTKAPQCVPVQITETVPGKTVATGKQLISNASAQWGLRSSFRNYISGGIAHGGWDLNGTTYSKGQFSWGQGSGNVQDGKGSVSFPGGVHFYGHDGVLDMNISNLRLDFDGATGVLYADVSSSSMDGTKQNFGTVAFANVNTSSLSVKGDKITLTDGAATLTETGAKAFADFYKPGDALDAFSFSGTVAGEKTTSAASTQTRTVYQGENCDHLNRGSLAKTGANSVALVAGVGGALVLAGAGALFFMRRRSA